jgi:hypothetical protein
MWKEKEREGYLYTGERERGFGSRLHSYQRIRTQGVIRVATVK